MIEWLELVGTGAVVIFIISFGATYLMYLMARGKR
jgi:hypothetical protein